MFALTTQSERDHRRFLVLDEQDCWLRPDLVPLLVKIVHDAGTALDFQVIMISHHDTAFFERYAEKVYRFVPVGGGAVRVEEAGGEPPQSD
jgi:predicted ATPase